MNMRVTNPNDFHLPLELYFRRKRMKTLTRSILISSLLALTMEGALAADFKIGVIDMRAVVSASPQAKETMERLKKEFKSREEKMAATDKSLKEKAEKLQRNSAVMSESEKTKLER